ncbi:MAG: ZIP family metal transporter, partial [Clostridiaceae bacterium]|nr:ZIP family metal transporter [Clostridiaceae bacterium]
DPQLGFSIAFAIAIHNIPEGIAVAVPLYAGTGDKKRSFLAALRSGLAEPLGALLGFVVFRAWINDVLLGVIFAAIAGIMVFISFDELLPSAEKQGEHHIAIAGLMTGMAIMAISLIVI